MDSTSLFQLDEGPSSPLLFLSIGASYRVAQMDRNESAGTHPVKGNETPEDEFVCATGSNT